MYKGIKGSRIPVSLYTNMLPITRTTGYNTPLIIRIKDMIYPHGCRFHSRTAPSTKVETRSDKSVAKTTPVG